MQPQRRTTPYEVLCHHCNVTFPVGAKRCIHCGGRLGKKRGGHALPLEMATPFEGMETDEEEKAPKRSSFMPAALLWALLFAGMSIHRACSSS